MKCRHAKRKLSEFLDGVLPPAEEPRLREHLEQCRACSRELELLRKTIAALRSLPKHTPPQDLPSKIRAALAEKRTAKPRFFAVRPLQTAAAAALLVFLGVYGFFMRELARRPVSEQVLQSRKTETSGLPAAALEALDASRTAGPEQAKHYFADTESAAPEPAQVQPAQAMGEADSYAPALPAEIPEKKSQPAPASTARRSVAASQPSEEKKQESVLYEDMLKAGAGTEKEYTERIREDSRRAKDKSAFAVPPPPPQQAVAPALSAMPASKHFRRETDIAKAAIPAQKTIELTLENADSRAVCAVLAQYSAKELDASAGLDSAENLSHAAPPRITAKAAAAPQAKQKEADAVSMERTPPHEQNTRIRVFTVRVPAAKYQQLLNELQQLGRLSELEPALLETPAEELEIFVRLTVRNP